MSDFEEKYARTKGKAKDAFEDAASAAPKESDREIASRAGQMTRDARLAADEQLAARDLKRQHPAPALRPNQPGLVQAVHGQVREQEAQQVHAAEQAKAKARIEKMLQKQAEERARSKSRGLER